MTVQHNVAKQVASLEEINAGDYCRFEYGDTRCEGTVYELQAGTEQSIDSDGNPTKRETELHIELVGHVQFTVTSDWTSYKITRHTQPPTS